MTLIQKYLLCKVSAIDLARLSCVVSHMAPTASDITNPASTDRTITSTSLYEEIFFALATK